MAQLLKMLYCVFEYGVFGLSALVMLAHFLFGVSLQYQRQRPVQVVSYYLVSPVVGCMLQFRNSGNPFLHKVIVRDRSNIIQPTTITQAVGIHQYFNDTKSFTSIKIICQ